MNQLFYGDNLDILRKYIDSNSIDLCYIDPPFNSKRNYNQIYNNFGQEDRAQAQAFIDTWEWDEIAEEGYKTIKYNAENKFNTQTVELISAYKKILGNNSLTAYLINMTLRIYEIYRVLKPTGSFYLHCDPTASHYLKLLLDSIFCSQDGDFKNEIIWHYKKWSIKQKQFVSNHDVIFFYTKTQSKDRTFNQLFMPRAASTLKRFGNAKIVSGHDEGGKRLPSKTNNGDESEGVAMDDVWDIGRVPPVKQLYPTQKPEPLLERIIMASSNEGDVVLDAYCGCGTTVTVAQRLKRKWIGIDITYQSISLILKRLEDAYSKEVADKVLLSGVPKDYESAIALAHKKDDRVRKEFEKWAVLTYSMNKAMINEKKGADGGIDGVGKMLQGLDDFRDILFSVKSGHLVPDYIRAFCRIVEREGAAMGIFITLEKPSSKMLAEARAMGKYFNPLTEQEYDRVSVVTIKDIINGERLNVPTSAAVVKKAELVKNKMQPKLF